MKIQEIKDENGRVFAFEVSNTLVPRFGVRKIIQAIPGVKIIEFSGRPSLCRGEDEFCQFEVDGVRFVLEELWGDSDTYWIGPKSCQWCPQVETVRKVFASAKPFFGLVFGLK